MTIRIPAIVVALAVVCAASIAQADTTSTPASAATAQKKATDSNLDGQVMVCKREDVTGSRLGASKVCHTRAEWAAQADAARSQVNTWQAQAHATMPH